MSRAEIITTTEGRANAPLNLYQFPLEESYFIGTLAYRAWHPKKQCLICYFDTDNGEQFKLMAWWNRDNAKSYTPKKCDVNFTDDVINGSRWKCGFVKAKGGSITWMAAVKIDLAGQ